MPTLTAPARTPAPPAAAAEPRPFRFTREQYYRMGELGFFDGRRVELVRGEIIEMSPIGWRHQLAKSLVAEVLRRVFGPAAWVNEQGPLRADDTEPQPDVAVIAGRPRDFHDHPTTALLVVEVAETSLNYDLTEKAEIYATAGVPEYWVLDLDNQTLIVLRDPAPLPAGLGATAYRTHVTLGPADTVAPLAAPTTTVAVADLLP